jgi:hypothetical protein
MEIFFYQIYSTRTDYLLFMFCLTTPTDNSLGCFEKCTILYLAITYIIGPSEVRALPVRRCRRAAWQTKWPLNLLFFSLPLPPPLSLLLLLRLISL